MEFGFTPTRFELEWLPGSLGGFYEDHWFTNVLYRVKGGKEATVYCCEAHPSTGSRLLAAKVYRPRKFRAMRNDAIYREGRAVLGAEGKAVLDQRSHRALKKKSRLGKRLMSLSWLQHEYQTMGMLYDAGADIPEPLAQSPNAILMQYVGDENASAPTLHEITLEREEARRVFEGLIENVTCFLACDRVHGDLSAFNVLYWEGAFTVIDFPQAVDAVHNPSAFFLLLRDVERLCQYFSRYGVEASAVGIAEDLWRRYMRNELR